MKILFVTSTCPENIQVCTHGIFQRMRMFLEALSMFADLEILFYASQSTDISPEAAGRMERALAEHWGCTASVNLAHRSPHYTVDLPSRFPFGDYIREWWFLHPFFYWLSGPEQLLAFDRCLERKPDAIFVHRLNSFYPVLANRKVEQPVFFDLDDIEHKSFARGLMQAPSRRSKPLQYLKALSLMWLERRAAARSQRTFVCSETDRKYLTTRLRASGVIAIPNAIEIPVGVELQPAATFLFIGTYLYQPNAQAADHLVCDIWPLIRDRIPAAKLIIAGAHPEKIRSFHGRHAGVEFRGFVDDLDALYREVRVVCCPIRAGSGTRIKIIEAAAYGKAVVSTSIGAEGLDFLDGRELLIRDDPDGFARACIDLVADSSHCNQIGRAAREKCSALYGKCNTIRRIKHEILDTCLLGMIPVAANPIINS
ncbi:glycosyltransferase [Geobacter sp. SVR]|uniref:glycosyltransferase n=1 Tax=Geobacter sp. SVR TaxID=2495594 RepID=UPI00143EFC83|nr:glycosyltransferase [Geobacter sp. SVR]BCS54968.1 hypothetical protein GSVR_32760 [Geobacter sp. SVR]GCF86167.1 hypothetical protein GSbR_27670 [Geobacter sp. SVR]